MAIVMNRRELVCGLAAGTVVAMTTGCAENEALGRSQFLLVSDEQLAQLSAGTWSQFKQQERFSTNRSLNSQVNRIGDAIVRTSGLTNQNWEYTVIESDTINAFVMPGGKVAFYRGILDVMENDAQIATVMGHEVGHVAGRHAAERYSQAIAAQTGMQLANVAISQTDTKFSKEIAAVLGAGVTFGVLLPYSRQHEYEADRLGVQYMHRAGYDAREAVLFWNGMAARSAKGNKPLEFMSTHPSDINRIKRLQSVIGQLA